MYKIWRINTYPRFNSTRSLRCRYEPYERYCVATAQAVLFNYSRLRDAGGVSSLREKIKTKGAKKVRSRILYLKGRRILEGIRGVRRHRGHRLSATPALNIGHR